MLNLLNRWPATLGLAALLWGGAQVAHAQDYYYEPRSFYVTPPLYGFTYPVLGRAPILIYEPGPPPLPPVVGYYETIPGQVGPGQVGAGPVGRVRERGYSSPYRARYKYKVEYPGGLEYKLRYKRDGGYVRYYDTWGH